jgi:transposase
MAVTVEPDITNLSREELIALVHRQKQEIYTLRRLHFGSSSERHVAVPDSQSELELFNEAEMLVLAPPVDSEDDISMSEDAQASVAETPPVSVGKPSTARRGRKKLPETLPRVEVIHELTGDDRNCPCCGKARRELGEEVSEELEFVPAHFVVHKHIRKTYGECTCEDFVNSGESGVIKAPLPRLIPGSPYSSGTIAYIIASKYVDALPLYRQEDISARAGYRISRNTMAHLCIQTAVKLKVLYEMMEQDLRGSPVIRFDETTVQVLKEKGRSAQAKSYAWVSYGYLGSRPIILFRYFPGRRKEYAAQLLEGFSGFAQTDGYTGYDEAISGNGATHVGCWAHIRRKFKYAYDSSDGADKDSAYVLEEIGKLYELERDLRMKLVDGDISEPEFSAVRTRNARRIMSRIELWLGEKMNSVTPASSLGKAVHYAWGQLDKAKRYVAHHLLTPDNNPIERAIRPFVTGRKNWMFSQSVDGAEASMILYSFAMTAKANGLEPVQYLSNLLTALPMAELNEHRRALLLYNYAAEQKSTPGGYFLPEDAPGTVD